jgi:catalase
VARPRNSRSADARKRLQPVGDVELGVPNQASEYLTTAHGVRLPNTDHSLKAGPRGPSLMDDFHLREKITHFDHERIPERVVHARGAAAHGVFRAYGNAAAATKAGFLGRRNLETQVFVRFSTVAGSRGSADTVRDVRGFAVKFYTEEGNFDLVGNNMPVFFIQDGIKFPDVIHAVKPHPDREIPQAQSAHDTFWDFVSLHTEATHHVMWLMSDRAIPRSYRTMEGFGVHTFRLVNAGGEGSLVKFHWKPLAGVHSLVWEEAQIAAGCDPDFHRRDLADSIDQGLYPEWELGLQILPDSDDEMFEGIDLLDPTKLVPEELAPVQLVGRLTLDRNPTNYFAETEQVAFHTGNLVPGIEVTNDPLMQARLFSYLDTQLIRLGGPNFTQLPINCPHVPINDMQREGMHQTIVHEGLSPYLPNSIDGGPLVADEEHGGYVHVPRMVSGPKVREAPASFDDHFSQAALFWASLSEVEQEHVAEAFMFELGKCYETPIRERVLANLAQVDGDLCARVAAGVGLETPPPVEPVGAIPSPALQQVTGERAPIVGRIVGVVVAPGSDLAGVAALRETLAAEGAVLRIVAEVGGTIGRGQKKEIVERTFLTTRSIEYDAVLIAGGTGGLDDEKLRVLLHEAYRHFKVLGSWGDGVQVLERAGIDPGAPGVLTADEASPAYLRDVVKAVAMHRFWGRALH